MIDANITTATSSGACRVFPKYKTYTSIDRRDGGDDRTSISKDYPNRAALGVRKVIWSNHPRPHYHVFENQTTLHDAYAKLIADDRRYHEVVFEGPQKLKFDIDAKADLLGTTIIKSSLFTTKDTLTLSLSEKFTVLVKETIEAIKTTFFYQYDGTPIRNEDLIICESADPTGGKFSMHIIIANHYVSGSTQSGAFTRSMLEVLPEWCAPFIDKSVNKTTQNFRLVESHKDGRVKRILTSHHYFDNSVPSTAKITHTWYDALISNISNCTKLKDITSSTVKDDEAPLVPEDIKLILDKCKELYLLNDFVYRDHKHGIINFNRIKPSFCELCNETHHVDNTQCIRYKHAGHGISLTLYCRHNKGGYKYLCTLESTDPTIKGVSLADRNSFLESVIKLEINRNQQSLTKFDSLPAHQKHMYVASAMDDYELMNTLIIHAPMKIGKTKKLREYLDKYYTNTLAIPKVRFISFRKTFTRNVHSNFPEFTVYDAERGDLADPKLIIQVESLHRMLILEHDTPPELLILDECESIFDQFTSNLQRSADCFSKFQYLMKYSQRVICMDAYITDRTYNLLQLLRSGFEDKCLYHRNSYKNGKDDTYYFTSSILMWSQLIIDRLGHGDKIVIASSSLKEAEIIYLTLSDHFPEKKIKLYSSETADNEKNEHFLDVDTFWAAYEVLIYTPTVSAGLSFEVKHYDRLFGYFTNKSCTVETCMQMMGRVRDIGAKEYIICLSFTGEYNPTTEEDIIKELHQSRSSLFKEYGEFGLTCSYNEVGTVTIHDSDYFKLWVQNILIRNLSKQRFISRFISRAGSAGAKLSYLGPTEYLSTSGNEYTESDMNMLLTDRKSDRTNNKLSLKNAHNANITSASELTDQEYDLLMSKSISDTLRGSEKAAIDKFLLRRLYRYNGKIDDEFVATYEPRAVRQVYENLTALHAKSTTIESLDSIKTIEALKHTNLMSQNIESHQRDLFKTYVYNKHKYATTMLRACGWDDVTSEETIAPATIYSNVKHYCNEHKLNIYELAEDAAKSFNKNGYMKVRTQKESSSEFDIRFLALTRFIVKQFYGHEITKGAIAQIINKTPFAYDKSTRRWTLARCVELIEDV